MKNYLVLDQTKIRYTVKKNSRTKNLRLSISPHGEVVVTLPWYLPQTMASVFIKNNQNWLLDKLKQVSVRPRYSPNQLTELKIRTRNLVRERLAWFNQTYGFHYHRITIRNQKTRWGSCSSNKTLSFNLKLCILPSLLSDYVVVHELCHLKEMNHGPRFWQLVAKTIPNYKRCRRELKNFHSSI